MLDDKSFWGSQGRIAHITSGEYTGRLAFVYPESVPAWWTIVVDPSPFVDAPLEMYLEGTEELAHFVREWGLTWIPAEDDESIERAHFALRPLTGRPWTE